MMSNKIDFEFIFLWNLRWFSSLIQPNKTIRSRFSLTHRGEVNEIWLKYI